MADVKGIGDRTIWLDGGEIKNEGSLKRGWRNI